MSEPPDGVERRQCRTLEEPLRGLCETRLLGLWYEISTSDLKKKGKKKNYWQDESAGDLCFIQLQSFAFLSVMFCSSWQTESASLISISTERPKGQAEHISPRWFSHSWRQEQWLSANMTQTIQTETLADEIHPRPGTTPAGEFMLPLSKNCSGNRRNAPDPNLMDLQEMCQLVDVLPVGVYFVWNNFWVDVMGQKTPTWTPALRVSDWNIVLLPRSISFTSSVGGFNVVADQWSWFSTLTMDKPKSAIKQCLFPVTILNSLTWKLSTTINSFDGISHEPSHSCTAEWKAGSEDSGSR